MEIHAILDYLLDVSKVLVAGLLTFILYNINKKRAEKRIQTTSDKEVIVELREDKILGAISNLQTDMDGKFQAVNTRLDTLQTDMDGKFQAVNTRLDTLQTDMDGKFQAVNTRLDTLQTDMDGKFTSLKTDMGGKFQAVNTRLDSLQTDITQIKYNQGLLVMELKTLGVIKETPVI
jgi:Flp pilus assembly pilin Flp